MNCTDYFFKFSRKLNKDFLVGTEEKITFKNLYTKVVGLAGFLNKKYGQGKNIMLLSENNLFYISSYLAIMKSGNTVIPIETTIQVAELKELITRCSPIVIFAQEKIRNKVNGIQPVFTEKDTSKIKGPKKLLSIKVSENDLAQIIFTSGSTGKKKGVMLTHKNLVANTASIIKYLKLTKKDRMVVVLPFPYVYGASLLHTHLRIGGSLVINKSIFLNCLNAIDRYRCTGFAGVPSTYQILISKTAFLHRKLPSLKYMTQAGGKLANNFIVQIADAFPNKEFFVMYGATEATARLSYLPPTLVKTKLGSIGKGIPGVTLEVLNKKGLLVKPNKIGHLTAQGDNIMKGYYQDHEGTKKVLKNGRYFTGDLAKVDAEGFIYIVGRANRMIKSAGYRIAPYEIEGIINSIPGIVNCVVVGIPDSLLGETVAAAVEAKKNKEQLKKAIIETCNQKLNSYKVPKEIIFLDCFPLNTSLKIDTEKITKLFTLK